MAKTTLLLKLIRYIDDDGVEHLIEVRPEVADVLEATEAPLKERLLRKPEAIGKIADRGSGNAWEGPRLRFRWLVGESRTWHGEPVIEFEGKEYCTICWGGVLPEYAYCLGCDRSGRELEIPGPNQEVRARRRAKRAEKDGLKGGLKGKR